MDDARVVLLFLSDYNNVSYKIVFMRSAVDSYAFMFQYHAMLLHLELWFPTFLMACTPKLLKYVLAPLKYLNMISHPNNVLTCEE